MAELGSLKVEGLRKRMGGFTLEATFEVRAGERAALVGRSGGGKTTLLRLLAGLETPDLGRMLLGDADITSLPPQARGVGLVFQDYALFPALDVLENAAFGLRVRGVGRAESEAAAMPWLEKAGLAPLAHARVDRLSGGERSRVAFVRALVWKPRLILLDEPFSALDPATRDALRRQLVELHALWPAPLVIVSHDAGDLAAVATSKFVIEESAAGALRAVKRAP